MYTWEIFEKSFYLSCWIATLILVSYCIYDYQLNNDLCTIELKNYYDTKLYKYPVLSLCLPNPISEDAVANQIAGANASSYLKFLKGEYFQPNMLSVDYKSVIKNMSDYIEEDFIEYRNGSFLHIHPEYNDFEYLNTCHNSSFELRVTNESKRRFSSDHAGFYDSIFYSCYSLSLPQDPNILTFYFRLNSNIFPSSVRNTFYDLITFLHYPNQLLISTNTMKYHWPVIRQKNESYSMLFKIDGAEVLRRRQKPNTPCFENWERYDDELKKIHVKNVGCKPPYMNSSEGATLCSSKDQNSRAYYHLLGGNAKLDPACWAMESIYYTYAESSINEKEVKWAKNGSFWIGIKIFERFKEISMNR